MSAFARDQLRLGIISNAPLSDNLALAGQRSVSGSEAGTSGTLADRLLREAAVSKRGDVSNLSDVSKARNWPKATAGQCKRAYEGIS